MEDAAKLRAKLAAKKKAIEEEQREMAQLEKELAMLEGKEGDGVMACSRHVDYEDTTEEGSIGFPESDLRMYPNSDRLSSSGRLSMNALPTNVHLDKKDVQIQGKIGEGSFGTVWRALYQGRTQVAVKLFKIAEVHREIITIANINHHPNVLHFIGVVFEIDDPYKEPQVALVTKFMGGGSLDDIFVNRSSKFYDVGGSIRFHFQRIVAMTSQAAAGVAHLHACGIIHRDLACRNFLADESGNVAVADFGFARERATTEFGGYSQTKTGPVRWEAPESLRFKQYSEATDAFMFGVAMWEMVAGLVPWENLSTAAAAHAVLSSERLAIPLNCDPVLAQLMMRCWQDDPGVRPKLADAQEILQKRAITLMEEEKNAAAEMAMILHAVAGQVLNKISILGGGSNSLGIIFGGSGTAVLRLEGRRVHVARDLRRLKWVKDPVSAGSGVGGAASSGVSNVLNFMRTTTISNQVASPPQLSESPLNSFGKVGKAMFLNQVTDVILGADLPVNLKLEVAEDLGRVWFDDAQVVSGVDAQLIALGRRAFTLVTTDPGVKGGRVSFVCPTIAARDEWVKTLRFLVTRLQDVDLSSISPDIANEPLSDSLSTATNATNQFTGPASVLIAVSRVRYTEIPLNPLSQPKTSLVNQMLRWRAVDTMKRGSFFLKIAAATTMGHKGKPHERYVKLSPDLRELIWEGEAMSVTAAVSLGFVKKQMLKAVRLIDVAELRLSKLDSLEGLKQQPVFSPAKYRVCQEGDSDDESDFDDEDKATIFESKAQSSVLNDGGGRFTQGKATLSKRRPSLPKQVDHVNGQGFFGNAVRMLQSSKYNLKDFPRGGSDVKEDDSESVDDDDEDDKSRRRRSFGPFGVATKAHTGIGSNLALVLLDRQGAVLLHLVAPNRPVFDQWVFGLDAIIRHWILPPSLQSGVVYSDMDDPTKKVIQSPQNAALQTRQIKANRRQWSHSGGYASSLEPILEDKGVDRGSLTDFGNVPQASTSLRALHSEPSLDSPPPNSTFPLPQQTGSSEYAPFHLSSELMPYPLVDSKRMDTGTYEGFSASSF